MADALEMQIPRGTILFVGTYGSGKTEVSVNLSRYVRARGENPVHLIDLDIVNPYFRSREAIDVLAREGVTVVAPKGEKFYAESPIILPEVRSLLQTSPGRVILDVGGDDAGATVLASLRDAIPDGSYQFWMVVNSRRPFTDSVDGACRMVRNIETASTLKTTGLVSNAHLLHETTAQIVLEGLELTREVGRRLSLPVVCVAADENLVDDLKKNAGVPVLPLRMTMRRPWEKEAEGGHGRA